MAEGDRRMCERCGARYVWRGSTSAWLKMTYCSALCEKGALGFTIETLLGSVHRLRRDWKPLFTA